MKRHCISAMVQFAAVVFKPLQLIDFFYDLEEEKYHK